MTHWTALGNETKKKDSKEEKINFYCLYEKRQQSIAEKKCWMLSRKHSAWNILRITWYNIDIKHSTLNAQQGKNIR